MDVGVAGCAWGFKVCCQMFKFESPTVGIKRTHDDAVIHSINDLEQEPLEEIIARNSLYLFNTHYKFNKKSNYL